MSSPENKIIRTSIGLVMVLYGLDQIKNPKSWIQYEPEWLKKLLPVSSEAFMQSHGSVNLGLGLLFISGWKVTFVSWSTFAWWLSILPFVIKEDWRNGARDFAIVASLLAVAIGVGRKSS